MAKLYTRKTLDELIKLYNKALKVSESEKMTWDEKYDILFSDDISGKIIQELDYYDPDGSPKEDCDAFMTAFERYVDRQEEILEELGGEEESEEEVEK